MINFCSFEDERFKLVEKALSSFNASVTRVAKLVVGGDHLKIPRSMEILCPFLSDLMGSLPLNNVDPVIIIPDCSSTSLKHLVDLLTTGCTEACTDLEAVLEVANILKIDIKNLVTSKCQMAEDDLDLEDKEIVDSDESLAEKPHAKQAKTCSGIEVAAFSKSFISVPNIMSDNLELPPRADHGNGNIENKHVFWCGLCRKGFETERKFEEHDKLFLFSSTSKNNELFSSITNNNQLFSSTTNNNQLLSSTTNNNELFSSTTNNNELFSSNSNNNKLFSLNSDKIDLFSSRSNNNALFSSTSSTFRNLVNDSPLGSDEKEASFKCPECDRAFSGKVGLKMHMKNTTKHNTSAKAIKMRGKSNPALKPVIPQQATTPLMNSSKKLETAKWMFKCEMCELRFFKRKIDLNNHKQGFHNWCSGCFSSFKSQTTLKNHREECCLPDTSTV